MGQKRARKRARIDKARVEDTPRKFSRRWQSAKQRAHEATKRNVWHIEPPFGIILAVRKHNTTCFIFKYSRRAWDISLRTEKPFVSFLRKIFLPKKEKSSSRFEGDGKERREIVHIARSIVHIVHVELIRLTRAKDRQGETEGRREGGESKERKEGRRESLNAARTRGSTVVYASRCPGLYVSSRGLFRRARRPVSITQAATAAATDKVDSAAVVGHRLFPVRYVATHSASAERSRRVVFLTRRSIPGSRERERERERRRGEG